MKKCPYITGILLASASMLAGCAGEEESSTDSAETRQEALSSAESTAAIESTAGTEAPGETATEFDPDRIRWVVPNYYITLNADLLNQQLQADGYAFQVAFQYLSTSDEGYQEEVEALLSDGQADIAWLGGTGNDYVIMNMARSGLLMDLSEYLDSDAGKPLKDAFYDELWDTVRIDGQIYSIPNQIGVNGADCYVFNKDFFTEEDLKGFDGTPAALKELLDGRDAEEFPVVWDAGIGEVAFAAKLEYRYGCLFDTVTGEVYSPCESEAFLEQMDAVRAMLQAGYFGAEAEFYQMQAASKTEEHTSKIEGMDFALWAGRDDEPAYGRVRDQSMIVRMPYAYASRLNISVGIGADAPHREEALELLTLLYTDPKYANLLLWGQEGTDYNLEDGVGNPISSLAEGIFVKEMITGMADLIYLSESDRFLRSTIEAKRARYESEARYHSVVTGFQADISEIADDVEMLESAAETALDQYIRGELSGQELEDALSQAGAEQVKEELQRQVSEWLS